MLSISRRSHQPIVGTLNRFLKALNVRVSANTIEEEILSHPDYPSLLAVSDCLNKWKIDNVSTRVDKSQLDDVSLPFMAHLQSRLVLVLDVAEHKVTVFDENGTDKVMDKAEFLMSWDGIVLLAETDTESGEKYFDKKLQQQKSRLLPVSLLFLALSGLVLLSITTALTSGNWSVGYAILLLAKLAGVGITSLLLWYEIDKYNPALQKLCMGVGGKKSDCNAVLNSAHSKVFEWLSWSETGFIYFAASMLALLFLPESVLLITWLNILALPFIIFSLFYQGFVIKQWCLFCLSVVGLLLLEFAGSISGGLLRLQAVDEIPDLPVAVLSLGLIFMLVASVWFLLRPVLIQNHESKNHLYELNRLKNNRTVFESLLGRERRVPGTEGLGITLGNLDAPDTILKVCNPYCNPCAEAHKDLSRILDENPNLKIQIIYNTSVSHLDMGREPVRHFLAVAENAAPAQTKTLLDSWYFSKNKDYNELSTAYPLTGEVLEGQDDKIKAMAKWTRENNVMFTPTYFFNGVKLPAQYKLDNLSYILNQ